MPARPIRNIRITYPVSDFHDPNSFSSSQGFKRSYQFNGFGLKGAKSCRPFHHPLGIEASDISSQMNVLARRILCRFGDVGSNQSFLS
jgi:hypothetical protein